MSIPCYPETVTHILPTCPIYAQPCYINRNCAAPRVLYFYLRFDYDSDEKSVLPYAPQEIDSMEVKDICRPYWNYVFHTSRVMRAKEPDIVLLSSCTKVPLLGFPNLKEGQEAR